MNFISRIKAFGFALQGIATLFKDETHAKVHAVATIAVIVFGFYFKVSKIEWIALLLCIAFVLCLEAVNTAIENLTNLVTKDIHPLAKKAKDIGAGAVLLGAIFTAIIAGIIFIPKILNHGF